MIWCGANRRTWRDEEVWARLQAKKEVKEVRSEPEEAVKDTSKLKYKGPPARAPPTGNSKEAAERLYKAALKTESKKKDSASRLFEGLKGSEGLLSELISGSQGAGGKSGAGASREGARQQNWTWFRPLNSHGLQVTDGNRP